jgi:hypothetical protein
MTLYEQVVFVSKPYLGPATEQFIARQCKLIKVNPPSMGNTDLPGLAKWMEVGAGLLMDEKKAKELGSKIKSL